jgi:hypothetical protein
MKHHFNFIKPIAAHTQREINRWTKISLIFFGLLIISIAVTTSKQLLRLRSLHEEQIHFQNKTTNFTQTTTKQAHLKKEIEGYKKKLGKITEIQQGTATSTAYIKAIAHALPAGTTLQSLTLTSKTIDTSLCCHDTSVAPIIIEKLTATNMFDSLKISTLSPSTLSGKPGFIVTIQGKIKS